MAAAIGFKPVLKDGARHLLHKLGQSQLQFFACRLCGISLRHIGAGAADLLGLICRCPLNDAPPHMDPAPGSIGVAYAGLGLKNVGISAHMGVKCCFPGRPVLRVRACAQAVQAGRPIGRAGAHQGVPAFIDMEVVGVGGPFPGAQVAALQRQLIALLVLLQARLNSPLVHKKQRNPQGSQHCQQRACGVPEAALRNTAFCGRQRLVVVQSHAHHKGILAQPFPGMQPLDTVNRRLGLELALHAVRVAQKFDIGRHGQAQHLFLPVRARQIGAIVAHQQRHVVATCGNVAEMARKVLGRNRQHHHAIKLPAPHHRVRKLHRPFARQTPQRRPTDRQGWLGALGVHLEVLSICNGNRCVLGLGVLVQARKNHLTRSVGHINMPQAAVGKCGQGRAHGDGKVVVGLRLAIHGQAACQIFQTGHQCPDVRGHGGGHLHGAQMGLVFGKGELVALLCQQLPPIDAATQSHQHQRPRDAPEPYGRWRPVGAQTQVLWWEQVVKNLHLSLFYRCDCKWLHTVDSPCAKPWFGLRRVQRKNHGMASCQRLQEAASGCQ